MEGRGGKRKETKEEVGGGGKGEWKQGERRRERERGCRLSRPTLLWANLMPQLLLLSPFFHGSLADVNQDQRVGNLKNFETKDSFCLPSTS